mmetsp:Transcript_45609/g.121263  ORF Transcript_45609/g.121263 Transcript_45609/m.121263 type:complete len:304 (-) Transcript_45609:425-1336(-)
MESLQIEQDTNQDVQSAEEEQYDDHEEADESDISGDEDDGQTSQFVRKPGRGCEHYSRGCRLVSPCCDEEFWCRFCHNAAKDAGNTVNGHTLDRHAVKEVVCGDCNLRQPVSQFCMAKGCSNKFGEYFCKICNFFDDEISKKPFHCEGCGICRVGGRENFFHCETCGCCYATELRNNHRCIQGSMHQNCPVCQENLFNSTSECRVLRCGHTMHRDCLRSLMTLRPPLRPVTCPLCSVSIMDNSIYWQQLDMQIARTPMPEDAGLPREVTVLCNDCHATGMVRFHVFGLKCPNGQCGGYNTRAV